VRFVFPERVEHGLYHFAHVQAKVLLWSPAEAIGFASLSPPSQVLASAMLLLLIAVSYKV
jgi:hypothetical protein